MNPNIQIPTETVSVSIGGEESTTVPSGEVWRVTLLGRTGDMVLNGETSGQEDDTGAQTVFTGGDVIENDGFTTGQHIYLGGWKFDEGVGNTAISETLTDSESVTVPAGEVWRVTLIGSTDDLEIDGESVGRGSTGHGAEVVFGDGVEIGVDDTNSYLHLGGFVVSE
ncbi:hypothetical protein [Natrialba sp. SSL1]|uniref:hypothetical protein n=1 Tax=Natrialba sp. SSL1 TaxID=1869245 RepID=UPI0008F8EADC|nr:hypothetical protein [Natrialba sp. SSL1]OIB56596.1 hypothetical protein BBD46_16540 [Natrialba sp. SSL1]